MRRRTSFEDQAAALARLMAKNGESEDPALKDAVASLAQLRKVFRECQADSPDPERVANLLTDLLMGS